MLERLRAASRSWIAWVFLAVVGLAVAFTGGFGSFGGGLGGDVAKIGDERFSYTQFQRAWRQELQRIRVNQDRSITDAQAREAGLPAQLIGRLSFEARMRQEADALELAASDALVVRAIAEIDGVRDPLLGGLDRDAVRSILSSYQLTEDQFIAVVRDEVIRGHVFAALQAGVTAPAAFAEHQQLFQFQERLVSAVFAPYDAVAEPAAPSDEAVAAYYEANARAFTSPEVRALQLVLIAPDVEAAAAGLDEEMIARAVEDAIAAETPPSTRDLVELPAPDAETAAAAAARLRAGETPEAVVAALGLTGVNRYEDATPGELPDSALADAAFALETGAVSDPIATALSWSVVRVEAASAGAAPDPAIVRAQVVDELAEARALGETAQKGRDFERALTDGATLAEAANATGLPLIDIPSVTAAGLDADGAPVAALAKAPAALQRAFSQQPGLTTPVVTADDGQQFALRVSAITPAEPLSLEAARDEITVRLTADARAQAHEALVEQVRAALATGAPLREAAAIIGDDARTDMYAFPRAAPPEALGAQALRLFEPGQTPGDVVALPVTGGVAIARFETAIPTPPESGAFLAMFQQPLRQAIAQDVEAMYLGGLAQRYAAEVQWETVDRAVGAVSP